MVKVQFCELSRPKGLKETEKRINEALRAQGLAGCEISLFQSQDGKIGYTAKVAQVIPSAGGRKAFDAVHKAVCQALDYRRGRPAGVPTHQVKCRVPEPVYQRLIREAQKRHVTPSSLVSELVARQVGA